MTTHSDVTTLAGMLGHYGHHAYLITINDKIHAHVVPVAPVLIQGGFELTNLGDRSLANANGHAFVTLLWPPAEATDYSLIVDGVAKLSDGGLRVVSTRAVLHRDSDGTQPTPTSAPANACGADCVELTLA